MIVAELTELEEVKTLLTKGQAEGVLAYGEVASSVSELDLDESDIEELYTHLEGSGIELVEDVDPAQREAAPRADDKKQRRAKAPTARRRQARPAAGGWSIGLCDPNTPPRVGNTPLHAKPRPQGQA
jgi:uncharacterized membrane-anchored protein YhcB (DUF1043 family)